jgi:hypothetical protein
MAYKDPEQARLKSKNYYKNVQRVRYTSDAEYREHKCEIARKYYEKNKLTILQKLKNKVQTHQPTKLKQNYRNLINIKFKSKNAKKQSRATELLGCKIDEFKKYIESKFEDWMTWDNGPMRYNKKKRTWQIDHIIPVNNFNLENIEEAKKAFHYTNCRPLCAKKNLSDKCRTGGK